MVGAWTRWEKDSRARGGPRPPLPPTLPVVLSHDPQGWRGPKRLLELCRLPPEDGAMFGRFVPAFDDLVDDLARVSHVELLGIPAHLGTQSGHLGKRRCGAPSRRTASRP
jgi:hypothetical protein